MSDNTRLYEVLAFFQQAHLLLEDEIKAHGETYALADANAMAVDGMSQIRGELNARFGNAISEITAIVVKGAAA